MRFQLQLHKMLWGNMRGSDREPPCPPIAASSRYGSVPMRGSTLPNLETDVEIVDLSPGGVFWLPAPAEVHAAVGTLCTLRLRLDELGTTIRMETTVVHREGGYYGL